MLNWWPVVKHLSDYLAMLPEFLLWSVYPGSKGSEKDHMPCCEVQWNQETGISVNNPKAGEITLWLDLWGVSDEVNSDEVYAMQYAAQLAILENLREWSEQLLHDLGLTVSVECQGAAPHSASTLTTLGCRIILIIEWGKKRYV